MFFSFDGIDGVGKTTQIDLLVTWLRSQGCDVVRCRDPGSTLVGERVRDLVLSCDPQLAIGPSCEMLLYMAARAQLVDEVIAPALAAGKTVVSDRFLLSNVVYQAYAGGLDVDDVWRVGRVATRGHQPDLTFLLDMPVAAAGRRISRPRDRMEMRSADYAQRLRDGFLCEARRQPDKITLIDATRPVHEVHADVLAAARRLLGRSDQ